MKITNPLNFIPVQTTTSARAPQEAAGSFQALLKERCQEAGAPATVIACSGSLDLAGSVLDLLDRVAGLMAGGATAKDMAAPHEQLARQVARLREVAGGLEPNSSLKGLLDETASLAYVQLYRYEQGDFS